MDGIDKVKLEGKELARFLDVNCRKVTPNKIREHVESRKKKVIICSVQNARYYVAYVCTTLVQVEALKENTDKGDRCKWFVIGWHEYRMALFKLGLLD